MALKQIPRRKKRKKWLAEEYTTMTAYIPMKMKILILQHTGLGQKYRFLTRFYEEAVEQKVREEFPDEFRRLFLTMTGTPDEPQPNIEEEVIA